MVHAAVGGGKGTEVSPGLLPNPLNCLLIPGEIPSEMWGLQNPNLALNNIPTPLMPALWGKPSPQASGRTRALTWGL